MRSTLLRHALLADGTGASLRRADVRLSGRTISEVGELAPAPGEPTVDLDGLVLAPGFIDPHTHYDAQVLWDPDLTPTCWHGVTTVLTGNCGFGIAPLHEDQRTWIAETLENVEGMSKEVLAAGIPWSFESFPEYLRQVELRPKRLNVGCFVGHTPVRMYVMGRDAVLRKATPPEIEAMRTLVEEALLAGAIGFSTSWSPNHNGAGGEPVPSRLSDWEELRTLAGAAGALGRGIIEVTPGPGLVVEQLNRLSEETGRPVTWAALFSSLGAGVLEGVGEPGSALDVLARTKAAGSGVHPQVSSLPVVMQITLEDPFPFGMLASFQAVLAAPRETRTDIYRDPQWRAEAKSQLPEAWNRRWAKTTIDETERHLEICRGPSVAQLAEERGLDPFDLVCELSLEEDLRTRFRIVLGNDNEDELGELLRDPRCVLAVSDGGAHVSQICDARYPTHFLRYWIRERGLLSLEEAVRRLTGHPASVFGVSGRGVVRPGFAADLVAFDPETIGEDEPVRRWDLPGGGDRLIATAHGIAGVWVNGRLIVDDGGVVPGAFPGEIVRPSDVALIRNGAA